jgi:hypothetical protein
MTAATTPSSPPVTGIDPRGPRVGAAITAVLLVVVLLLPSGAATVGLLVVAVLFAVGAVRGAQGSVPGLLYRSLVRPSWRTRARPGSRRASAW